MESGSFYFDVAARGLGVFLGPTEARLMELAWERPSLTVKSASIHLGSENARAYTTVMTILNRLTEKGLLRRTKDGRNYVYRAVVGREVFIADRVARVQKHGHQRLPIASLLYVHAESQPLEPVHHTRA